MDYKIINGNCLNVLENNIEISSNVDLTFLDPPFNQNKEYKYHDDNMEEFEYWKMMDQVCAEIYKKTNEGGAIYFMQREKNTAFVLNTLKNTGWVFQNLIIWKKKTSAVPVYSKFGKQYQVIIYATKGKKAKTFHRLRINPELPPNYKHKREKGIFLTDVWDDIRELTSGFFAGKEVIRYEKGQRVHKQQAPIALLLRIILSSSIAGNIILDPFAGTGTTALVARQLNRKSISIEIDPQNSELIKKRIQNVQNHDNIAKYYNDYYHTKNLDTIWTQSFYKAKKRIKEPAIF